LAFNNTDLMILISFTEKLLK